MHTIIYVFMIKKLAFIALSVIATSCATITGQSTQNIAINSNVKGAVIKIDGQQYGETPTVLSLKGKSSYLLTVEKQCYAPKTQIINGEVRILAGVVGNIFNLTGLVGFGVDYFSGALFKLPTQQTVELDSVEGKCLHVSK